MIRYIEQRTEKKTTMGQRVANIVLSIRVSPKLEGFRPSKKGLLA